MENCHSPCVLISLHKHTLRNLVCDLAHHESPIAQWLEHPTSIWKVMGLIPTGNSKYSCSKKIGLRMLFRLFHIIQVTIPLITYTLTSISRA